MIREVGQIQKALASEWMCSSHDHVVRLTGERLKDQLVRSVRVRNPGQRDVELPFEQASDESGAAIDVDAHANPWVLLF